ncbi:NUDIX domain-containing protein [Deinococcus navajonensis]|uniref:NUDIX domain-containing protein n=1 Tax=Deinococcus navajonensis TaxID=309884 RepID=A0ABV8XQ91_9DEIO
MPGRSRGAGSARVGAGVAVVAGGQVLLVRRRDNGLWDIPGGAVMAGEVVEVAACRELQEETGLVLAVQAVKLLGVFSGPQHRHTYPDGNTVDWVTVLYGAQLPLQLSVQGGDDAAEARWWPLDALPSSLSQATQAYLHALPAPGASA